MKQKVHRRPREFLFVLVNYSWTWGLASSILDMPGDTTFKKKNWFPLANRYQLHMSSSLGMGSCIYFLLYFWNPLWLEPVQVSHCLSWVYKWISPVVYRKQFLWSHPSLLAFQSFCLLFRIPLWALRGEV